MRQVVLDIQSGLYAKAIRRSLMQELENYNIVISKAPQDTIGDCRVVKPYALLMEVTEYSPWMLSERLAIRDKVKELVPECKIVLLVDEVDRPLAAKVMKAKQDGLIDYFVFTSTTESYLAAVMDSL